MNNPPLSSLAISAPRLSRAALEAWLTGLARAGATAAQLRFKARSDAEVLEMARHAVEALSPRTRVLVNGRWDLCQLSDANGVHLPAAGLPVPAVRRALGEAALIGRSTHSLDEIRVAHAEGADYVTFGPVYATPGKEAFGAPQGLDRLEQAAQLGLPVVALGGITTIERIRDCVAVGACGIAGIRIFADGDRAAECVAAIREAIGARR